MSKKQIQEYERHTCGECAYGTYSQKSYNKDIQGKPFVKICEHSKWAINNKGQNVCLTNTKACEHYKTKDNMQSSIG